MSYAREVAFIEERELDAPVPFKLCNGGAVERGDPVRAFFVAKIFIDGFPADHSAVANEDDVRVVEILSHPLHRDGKGNAVAFVSGQNLNADGGAVGIAVESIIHLLAIPAVVAGIPKLGQLAALPLEIRRGKIEQYGVAVCEMLFGQFLLDFILPFQ